MITSSRRRRLHAFVAVVAATISVTCVALWLDSYAHDLLVVRTWKRGPDWAILSTRGRLSFERTISRGNYPTNALITDETWMSWDAQDRRSLSWDDFKPEWNGNRIGLHGDVAQVLSIPYWLPVGLFAGIALNWLRVRRYAPVSETPYE